MNCIDAIEGTTKSIIVKLHEAFTEGRVDDSEYIRNIKALLDGVNEFVQSNREIINDPKILEQVLYEFSKEVWLSGLQKRLEQESESENSINEDSEDKEYYEYYFDYIFAHNAYPK
jgi:capsular polysaccharide biosynthesis protein